MLIKTKQQQRKILDYHAYESGNTKSDKNMHQNRTVYAAAFGKSLSRKKLQNIQCPDIQSEIRPLQHGGALPVSEASLEFVLDSDFEKRVRS